MIKVHLQIKVNFVKIILRVSGTKILVVIVFSDPTKHLMYLADTLYQGNLNWHWGRHLCEPKLSTQNISFYVKLNFYVSLL